jgi:membrane protein DedA with SNARE-associated domain
MTIVTDAILLGIGCIYVIGIAQQNTPEAKEKRRQIMIERLIKQGEHIRKKKDKIIFITKFIDEIPDLSYYETVQLKNKLGDIYLEWNDE